MDYVILRDIFLIISILVIILLSNNNLDNRTRNINYRSIENYTIHDLPLYAFPFIRSHDAGSYIYGAGKKTLSASDNIANSLSPIPVYTQKQNFKGQYNFGARCFELRGGMFLGNLALYHGFAVVIRNLENDLSFKDLLLSAVRDKEIIILDFCKLSDTAISSFITRIPKLFQKYGVWQNCIEVRDSTRLVLNISPKALKEQNIFIIFSFNMDVIKDEWYEDVTCFMNTDYSKICDESCLKMDNRPWEYLTLTIRLENQNCLNSVLKNKLVFKGIQFIWNAQTTLSLIKLSHKCTNKSNKPSYWISGQSIWVEELSGLNEWSYNYITKNNLFPSISSFDNINKSTLKLKNYYHGEGGNKQINDPSSIFYKIVRNNIAYKNFEIIRTENKIYVYAGDFKNTLGGPIKFIIKTATDWYSGTDSQVIISLFDPTYKKNLKKLKPFYLDNVGNDFENGSIGTYMFDDINVGLDALTKHPIRVSLSGTDDWKIEDITVYYNEKFIKKYVLNVWLGDGKGSKQYVDLLN